MLSIRKQTNIQKHEGKKLWKKNKKNIRTCITIDNEKRYGKTKKKNHKSKNWLRYSRRNYGSFNVVDDYNNKRWKYNTNFSERSNRVFSALFEINDHWGRFFWLWMKPNFEEDRMKRRVIFSSMRMKRSFNFNAISHAAWEVYFKLTVFHLSWRSIFC